MLSAEIELEFGDGDYTFALLFPQQEQLEERCGYVDAQGNRRRRGIIAIYGDVLAGLGVDAAGKIIANPHTGIASALDCREIIRLGLEGGKRGKVAGRDVTVGPREAVRLCERYVDSRPIVERWTIAAAILRAAVEGYDPDPKAEPGKAPAPARPARKRRQTGTP